MNQNAAKYRKGLEITVYVVLGLFTFLFFMRPLTVFGGDLGRLLKEGELFITQGIIIRSNFFSFTMPEYPVVNYHWLGVTLYYLNWLWGGFIGLHLFMIALQLIPIGIYLNYVRQSNKPYFSWFSLTILLSLPLLGIAPQTDTFAFSLACSVLFLYFIAQYLDGTLKFRNLLIILLLLQLIWVNTHIYYWVGWLLPLFALLQTIVTTTLKQKVVPLLLLTLGCVVISITNPQFIQAWVAPFDMLSGNFPMLPKHLDSLWGAYAMQPTALFLYVMIIGLSTVICAFFFCLPSTRNGIFVTLSSLLFVFWGMAYVKNSAFIALAACIVLPQIRTNIDFPRFWLSYRSPVLSLYILLPLWWAASLFQPLKGAAAYGIGHEKHDFSSLEFFKKNNLTGNILSNYDIAGYLIWGLPSSTKIYIVNRPDAQSAEFYEKAYFPAIHSNAYWHKLKDVSDLKIIYFKLDNETADNLLFLGKRLDDGEWAMVYQRQNKEVIMLRRLPEYEQIISQYEIMPESK